MTTKLRSYTVITTINPPTLAVKKYADMVDSNVLVIGDLKTQKHWSLDNARFISLDSQLKLGYHLIKHLPLNHYSRKMIGYLIAADNADIIIDTDDDNIPKDNWGVPEGGTYFRSLSGTGFTNIYQWYTNQHIWPRGLPLSLINKNFDNDFGDRIKEESVGVWQGLADGDPDVDALYRLVINKPCSFTCNEALVLSKGLVSPFNSQSTLFKADLLMLMYLPVSVTFRFTDILRGLVAQPIMWASDYYLGFLGSNVFQERNEHNLVSDLVSEVPMYQHCEKIIDLVSGVVSSRSQIEDNLFAAYQSLVKAGITSEFELFSLEAWIKDVQFIQAGRTKPDRCSLPLN